MIADILEKFAFAPFLGHIPLIHTEHHAAPFLVRVARNRGIQREDSFARIKHQHRDVRHAQLPPSHHHAELFRHQFRFALAADAGGIDEYVLVAVVNDGLVNRVTGGPGHR